MSHDAPPQVLNVYVPETPAINCYCMSRDGLVLQLLDDVVPDQLVFELIVPTFTLVALTLDDVNTMIAKTNNPIVVIIAFVFVLLTETNADFS